MVEFLIVQIPPPLERRKEEDNSIPLSAHLLVPMHAVILVVLKGPKLSTMPGSRGGFFTLPALHHIPSEPDHAPK